MSTTTQTQLSRLVDDLVARLSIDEVISCLHQQVPAMPQHGLAAFHTGAEAAHGVAWLGEATVYPQPVGLAASWDEDLLRRVGEAVAVELRAMHASEPVKVSLNAWAPVVNPLRHPLWGRNEEGFSEDPWVTARLAGAYACGMRGDHEVFWRTVPTLKHLLAYNNERDRATSSSNLPPRVLHEYDLPAFLGPIAERAVGGVMPAYNLANGRPCHISGDLYDAIREGNPDLLTVSDAWAPTNLTGSERVFTDDAEAHAAALNAGLDSFTDKDADSSHTTASIRAAFDRGLVDEQTLRRAARRVLWARALTGELTPLDDPFSSIGPDDLNSPDHQALAREAVAKGVVLLENRILPLAAGASIGVVGPLGTTVKNDWYSGTPPYRVSVADAAAELGATSSTSGADRVLLRSLTTGQLLCRAADTVLVADQRGTSASDATFELTDWGWGQVTLQHLASGKLLRCQDNGIAVVDSDRPQGWVAQEVFARHLHDDGTVSLHHRGSRRWLGVEAWGGVVSATVDDLHDAERFSIEVIESGTAAARRVADENDVVLVVLGNDPHIHGRETADRPGLGLPPAQVALWRAAREANPNAVLVIVSSYPYALGGIETEARAVVWSSHGGQELGHGLLDVLTGAAEPTGRLAQTWWADESQLGSIHDYDIITSRQTWWYSPHRPLYSFGHGLTHGFVDYVSLQLDGFPSDGSVARVLLHNAGDRVAHELVQVYAASDDPEVGRRLLGSRRVVLEADQEAEVEVTLDLRRIQVWDEARGGWRLPACGWLVQAAPSADATRGWGGGHVSPEACVRVETSSQLTPAPWPLRAWAADGREGVVGVPSSPLHAVAVMAGDRGGRVVWSDVQPATGELAVRVRAQAGWPAWFLVSGGTEESAAGSRVELPVNHDGNWVELPLTAISAHLAGATHFEVTLSPGACLDWLGEPTS